VRKELNRYDEYKGKTVLYKQQIKGKTKTEKYILKEYFNQQENRPLIFSNNKGYLKAYFIGRREHYLFFKPYQPEKTKQKLIKTEEKYSNKIANAKETKKQKIALKRDEKLAKIRFKMENGNWFMSVVGEKPSIYDSVSLNKTVSQLTKYLHSKGYFNASIQSTVTHKKHKTKIKYTIIENSPLTIDQISYNVEDPELESILNTSIDNTLLSAGDRYDEVKITQERERINRLMKDNGYFKLIEST